MIASFSGFLSGLKLVDVTTFPTVWVSIFFNGEFDPGSGRTLAACLTHASRTVRPFGVHEWRTGE